MSYCQFELMNTNTCEWFFLKLDILNELMILATGNTIVHAITGLAAVSLFVGSLIHCIYL